MVDKLSFDTMIEAENWYYSDENDDADDVDWFADDLDQNYDCAEDHDDFTVSSNVPSTSGKPAQSRPRPNRTTNKKTKNEPEKLKPIDVPHSSLKVEMKNISISNDTKNLILDTLRSVYGENFSLDDTEILQSKRRLNDQYWINRGHLTVRNCYNYSTKKNIDKQKVNSLILENLERYGFHTNHCYEVLLHTNNDFEKSLQLLLSEYFNLKFGNKPGHKNIPELDDELVALQSIYENIIEEKVKHKYWVFHLQLENLAKWYFKNIINSTTSLQNRMSRSWKPLCRNFGLNGTCRFGEKCRFLHKKPSDENKKNLIHEIEWKSKSSFELEIRFLDDCNYPEDIPLILFSANHREFSTNVCLRITKYLLKEAVSCASQGYAYCYNLVDLLQNSSDNIINWLDKETESQLNVDPRKPLFMSEFVENALENCDENLEFIEQPYSRRPKKDTLQETHNRDEEIISGMRSKVNNYKYKQMQNERKQLPAWNARNVILDVLNRCQVVVIVGDTGCGKTTQIPQIILDEWLMSAAGLSNCKSKYDRVEIICTQPRRLSAIGVATRVAQERVEKVGETIGYQIRLESCSSSLTKLLFCTTGILLKKLESDSSLKTVTHLIVDEVHERSEESDFLLLILKELIKVRTNLKILLMSATLNAELFSAYFDGAPLVEIPGKMYPVEEMYLEDIMEEIDYVVDEYSKSCRKMNKTMSRNVDELEHELALANTLTRATTSNHSTPDEYLSAQQLFYRYKDYSVKTRKNILLLDSDKVDPELIVSVLTWIVDGDHNYGREGSILVFLPGFADIMTVNDELMGHALLSPKFGRFILILLHSSVSNEEQSAIFKKAPRGVRKIVLSTNIAETSITIDDCVFVVDSGKMKETRFDTSKNMSSLETMWISKANAKQRKGRAGRVMRGLCIRLYTHYRFEYAFTAQPVPEIQRVALDQVILRTKTLENFKNRPIADVLSKLIEPPTLNNIETAIERLKDIGAVDDEQELTALGRHLSVLPVDVKIGKLILFGAIFRCLDSVLTMAASLSNKSPFLSPFTKREEAEKKKREFAICNSDHLTLLNAYKKWHSIASSKWHAGKRFAEENFLSWKTLEMIGDLKHQYLDLLVSIGFARVKQNVRRRHHEDKVSQMTPRELNKNENNECLLSGILCAALYPNLVKILTPDKIYTSGIAGAIPKNHEASEFKFKTKNDGFVFLHPSSVNAKVSDFKSPYLVYQEKMKTSKIFIHDSTMVSAVSLMLFAGHELKIEINSGMYVVSLENGWLVFALRSLEDAKMLQHMRLEFSKLLEKKIENPFLNLTDNEEGKRIISTIIHIVTNSL